jgi:predicted transport protein
MRDAKLFRIGQDSVEALPSSSVALEKSLQTLIEQHLETLLGVRFVATEHATGTVHGGRIDTLGLDENSCPVIIEYKRSLNENVINQGLFYLNWLMDHKADFRWLALEKYGKPVADAIDWSAPRLLCIAGDFTKYDEHAVQQIPRNIELLRYRRYGDDLLLLEVVASTSVGATPPPKASPAKTIEATQQEQEPAGKLYGLQLLDKCTPPVRDRFEALRAFVLALGDVEERIVKEYISFRRLKSFASVVFRPQSGRILVYVNVSPDLVSLEPGFAQDMRVKSSYPGSWQLELTVDSDEDLESAKPLILKRYEAS